MLAIRAIFALTPVGLLDRGVLHRLALPDRRGGAPRDPGGRRGAPPRRIGGRPADRRTLAPPDERDVDEDTGWFLDHFSRGELKRVRRRGAHGALRDVLRVAALALVLTVGLALWVKADLEATGGNPGPLAVFAIVIAGFALTVFVFHLSRIGPALRLRSEGISDATIDAHLAHSNGERGSGVLSPGRGRGADGLTPG